MRLNVVARASSPDEYARRAGLENAILRAVDRDQLTLVWQPQVNLAAREVEGIEALVRWSDNGRGALSTGEFIGLAECSRLIFEIDQFVLRAACVQGNRIHSELTQPLRISVNISGAHFQRPDFPDVVAGILDDTGFPSAFLEIEITEGALVKNLQIAASNIRRLATFGVRVALDDFGTGHSNLSYLPDLKIDRIKIDQTFVHDLPQNRRTQAVVAAVVGMAEGLGFETIAEGIETEEQVQALLKAGCASGQGFLICRPLEAAQLLPWLRQKATQRRAARRPTLSLIVG